MRWRFAAFVLAFVALTGCSSMIARIDTDPSLATCTVTQPNTTAATIDTPGNLALDASPSDILVACSKEGYQTVRTTLAEGSASGGAVQVTQYARSESGIDRAYVISLPPSTQPGPAMAPQPRPTAADLTPFPKQPRRPGMEQASLPMPSLPGGAGPAVAPSAVRPAPTTPSAPLPAAGLPAAGKPRLVAASAALPAPAIPPGGRPTTSGVRGASPMATLAAEAEQEAKAANRAGAAMASGDEAAALLADSEALAMAQAQDMTALDESLLGEDELFEEETLDPGPRWHTLSASVTAHRRPFPESPAVSMPPDVPLKLVEQDNGWGLFEYETNFGSMAVAWIRMDQVVPPA
jgi:hypothetical protein